MPTPANPSFALILRGVSRTVVVAAFVVGIAAGFTGEAAAQGYSQREARLTWSPTAGPLGSVNGIDAGADPWAFAFQRRYTRPFLTLSVGLWSLDGYTRWGRRFQDDALTTEMTLESANWVWEGTWLYGLSDPTSLALEGALSYRLSLAEDDLGYIRFGARYGHWSRTAVGGDINSTDARAYPRLDEWELFATGAAPITEDGLILSGGSLSQRINSPGTRAAWDILRLHPAYPFQHVESALFAARGQETGVWWYDQVGALVPRALTIAYEQDVPGIPDGFTWLRAIWQARYVVTLSRRSLPPPAWLEVAYTPEALPEIAAWRLVIEARVEATAALTDRLESGVTIALLLCLQRW